MRSVRLQLQRWLQSDRGRRGLELAGYFAGGFFLSAAALARACQPIALGFLCAAPPGWPAILAALGGSLGYPLFWAGDGLQGLVWMIGGLAVVALVGDRGITQRQPLLIPALVSLVAAGSGVLFQFRWQDDTSVAVYLLRIGAAVGSAGVFLRWRTEPGGWAGWIAGGLMVLGLAQVIPIPWLGLGYVAAGFLGAGGSFPAAVIAGLALDLSQVTRVKMTGVLCAAYCLRMLPSQPKWLASLGPVLAFAPVAVLSGVWDVRPLPGLLLGGLLAGLFPALLRQDRAGSRSGEAAVAQVRLEQSAMLLRRFEQYLLLIREPELDSAALVSRSVRAACDTCPERRSCKARTQAVQLTDRILEQPGLGEEDLPRGCRKSGRLLAELRRGQEQLRRMKGERNRLATYRTACREQYALLADFLQGLSDTLADRTVYESPKFEPEVGFCSRSRDHENGDKCVWFEGPRNSYYILLCDGMGTGSGAARESREATELLRQMLTAGFPAEYALRCLNSLAVLRALGGCTTVDLVQLHLDTGRGRIYKWGAAASWLMVGGQLRKIGTVSPPPGLSQQSREMVDRLSLGGGEVLIMLSDGAGEEALLHSVSHQSQSPGEMAAAILERGAPGGDDATAVVVRLRSAGTTKA